MTNKMNYLLLQRNMAWRVYKYFMRNQHELEDEENMKLFERAKEISINFYISEHKGVSRKETEDALIMVSRYQNKAHPDNLEIDEIVKMLL